ncbi:MAG: hypothetical protein JNM34_12080 [Chthonomonadaceae bacterium]|nr:hypothetical protein [Chthonomonadaceae bacterium]
MRTNKHGLNDQIPATLKAEIAARCGFGCIFCGNPIVQYHHFDPEFVEAQEHRAAGITLLCVQHHDLATRRVLSKDHVRDKDENPKVRESGFVRWQPEIIAWTAITFGSDQISGSSGIKLGQVELTIGPDPSENAPVLVTCRIWTSRSRETLLLEIANNEIIANASSFRVQFLGSRFLVRPVKGQQIVEFELESGRLRLRQLRLKGSSVIVKPEVTAYQYGGQQASDPKLSFIRVVDGGSVHIEGIQFEGFSSVVNVANGTASVQGCSIRDVDTAFVVGKGGMVTSEQNEFINVRQIADTGED